MVGPEAGSRGEIKVIEGKIIPETIRTRPNPNETPNVILAFVVVAQDEKGELWMNLGSRMGEHGIKDEALDLRTEELKNELDPRIDKVMQVRGFVVHEWQRPLKFFEWAGTWSLWIPFSDYERYAKEKTRPDWERFMNSFGKNPSK